MEKQREKRLDLSKVDPQKAGIVAVSALLIVLMITLCITVVMRSNIQRKYADARNEIGEELYTQLYMLCQTFDQVSVPGQDLQNTIIPLMRDYYTAAQTLDSVLYNAFGTRYGVLSSETVSALDRAFEAYDAAFRGGKSTDEAQSAMQICMDSIRTTLGARFQDGVLKAA